MRSCSALLNAKYRIGPSPCPPDKNKFIVVNKIPLICKSNMLFENKKKSEIRGIENKNKKSSFGLNIQADLFSILL